LIPFQPLQDIIVVKVEASERVLASGLVIPHVTEPERQVADERDLAEVVAVGPGKRLASGARRPMSITVGDWLVFGRNKGQLIRYGETDYCVLHEEHAIGKLNGKGFEPLGGYIVAAKARGPEASEAGIVLPDAERDEAEVLAVGPGEILDDGELEVPIVREGDRILFNPRMAEPFVHEGRELLALKQAHIVCVVERK
jgi:chaperonin GroES